MRGFALKWMAALWVAGGCLACDELRAKEQTSAETAGPSLDPAVAAHKDRVFADLHRVEKALAAPREAWAAPCPDLEGKAVLLASHLVLARMRGATATSKYSAHDFELTPTALLAMSTNASDYERKEQQGYLDMVDGFDHIAVLRVTDHRRANPNFEGTFSPGHIEGWLFLVAKATGKPLCAVTAKATNNPLVRGFIEDKWFDDDLRRNLAQALMRKLREASGAELHDGESPVSSSKRFKRLDPKPDPKDNEKPAPSPPAR